MCVLSFELVVLGLDVLSDLGALMVKVIIPGLLVTDVLIIVRLQCLTVFNFNFGLFDLVITVALNVGLNVF